MAKGQLTKAALGFSRRSQLLASCDWVLAAAAKGWLVVTAIAVAARCGLAAAGCRLVDRRRSNRNVNFLTIRPAWSAAVRTGRD